MCQKWLWWGILKALDGNMVYPFTFLKFKIHHIFQSPLGDDLDEKHFHFLELPYLRSSSYSLSICKSPAVSPLTLYLLWLRLTLSIPGTTDRALKLKGGTCVLLWPRLFCLTMQTLLAWWILNTKVQGSMPYDWNWYTRWRQLAI